MPSPTQHSDGDHKADFAEVGSGGESIPNPRSSSAPLGGAQGSNHDAFLAATCIDPYHYIPAAMQQLWTIPQGHTAPSIAAAPIFASGTMATAGNIDTSTSTDVIQAARFANLFSQMARYRHQYAANLQQLQHTTVAPVDAPPRQPVPPSTVHAAASEQSRNGPNDASSTGKVLFLERDVYEISPYQCLVRKQIEAFAQPESDTEESMQGRNRPVQPGQVGIRCRHCGTQPRYRSRGAMLFPSTLLGLYQTAQNMANTHLVKTCRLIPDETRRELIEVRSKEKGKKTCKSSYGGGRRYWGDSLSVLGIVETPDRGLQFGSSRLLQSVDTGYGQARTKDE
jgi:hypothetical protein